MAQLMLGKRILSITPLFIGSLFIFSKGGPYRRKISNSEQYPSLPQETRRHRVGPPQCSGQLSPKSGGEMEITAAFLEVPVSCMNYNFQ